jgi:hypothetical protein
MRGKSLLISFIPHAADCIMHLDTLSIHPLFCKAESARIRLCAADSLPDGRHPPKARLPSRGF